MKVVLHFKTYMECLQSGKKIKTDTIPLCMFIMYFEKMEILPVIQVIDNTNLIHKILSVQPQQVTVWKIGLFN